jgi:ABC-type uncharacterized transport system substrate-binding protein
VRALGTGNDVLLLSNYRGLRRSPTDTTLVPPAEVVAWTEANSPVPVIGLNGFFTEDGGMLAIGASPYEQGEQAATRALDLLLRRRAISDMPVTSTSHFVVSMRGSAMRARRFELPAVYEAAARASNLYLP